MLILGIETSCDETSVAILEGDGSVRVNLINSQIARHQPFGGVVPEIASREHLSALAPLIRAACAEASIALADVDAVAVTSGPGLIGALLVGVAEAQGLSYGLGIPLVTVNHLEGHILSPYLRLEGASTPLPLRSMVLVVSDGHSSIYEVRAGDEVSITTLNRTRDDAAGEIFDKVGKFIGLPYPGGPHIDRLAAEGDKSRFRFPAARLKDEEPDFSFSGLKSHAIRLAREESLAAFESGEVAIENQLLKDFCASFQWAIMEQIFDRLQRVWDAIPISKRPTEIGLAGGVAANSMLRSRMIKWGERHGLVVRLAERRYCTDNAAMIAFAGLTRSGGKPEGDPRRVIASSRMAVRGAGS